MEALGFVHWPAVEGLVSKAFLDADADADVLAMRSCFLLAQWVVLAMRFDVATAVAGEDWTT